MTTTYEKIATTTLTSATGEVTFSSISGAFTDLILIIQAKTVTYNGVDINVYVNGDTASNYSSQSLRGNGSSASAARTTSGTYFSVDNLSIMNTTDWTISRMNFFNYSNTTTNKTMLARTDRAGAGTTATANLWRSTAAINSITLDCGADSYASGSIFSLYGIKAE